MNYVLQRKHNSSIYSILFSDCSFARKLSHLGNFIEPFLAQIPTICSSILSVFESPTQAACLTLTHALFNRGVHVLGYVHKAYLRLLLYLNHVDQIVYTCVLLKKVNLYLDTYLKRLVPSTVCTLQIYGENKQVVLYRNLRKKMRIPHIFCGNFIILN